jgi:hypothetical protein
MGSKKEKRKKHIDYDIAPAILGMLPFQPCHNLSLQMQLQVLPER